MLKKIVILIFITCCGTAYGQTSLYDSYKMDGEFGIGVGLGHYFGDLNTNAALNRPKFSAGVFFIKQFNNYIGFRVAGDYSFLGYSDIYSKNQTQQRRNLSFNSNMWEF